MKPVLCVKSILVSCLILSICITSYAVSASAPVTNSLAPMLKRVMPSVVNVQVEGVIKLPALLIKELRRRRQQRGLPNNMPIPSTQKLKKIGSGVIVDAKHGYVLTNAHVVKDGKIITVRLAGGTTETAKLIGIDIPSDVAVLHIKPRNLRAIQLGNSTQLHVGDFVAAIGNPFGLSQTVTSGIVSALQRSGLNIEGYENFIQTDAAINPGNSGGALVNLQGQLIGINTAILAPAGGNIGIGFAIPVNMARSIMLQLIKYGNVQRGLLGVYAQPLTAKLAKAFDLPPTKGVVITSVSAHSAAHLAGLHVGDVIMSVNSEPVTNPLALRNVIGLIRAGSKITIQGLHKGKPFTKTTVLSGAKKQLAVAEKQSPFFYGVVLRKVDQTTAQQTNAKGIQVLKVTEGTAAWRAGLMLGDIIVAVNQQAVTSIEQLHVIAQRAKKNNKSLLLTVKRGSGAVFVVVEK
ncbi:MAG: Do family serine endopeptidase [Gammaproteobacteria bacterium]|nr:Do family serine endopeptidase [Gammaproteobacteria bacterium]